MAATTTHSSTTADRFSKKTWAEYVRELRFSSLMGGTEGAPFQIIKDLEKQAGDGVTVNVVRRLTGAGVTNGDTLEGNEESLSNYGHKINLGELANGVTFTKWQQQLTEIDYLMHAKQALKNWLKEKTREDIIDALQSPVVDGVTVYADASEAQKDAWNAANNPASGNHRILFGAATANDAAGDHSANLSNVDSTTDVLDPEMTSLGRRLAMTCDPHIRPVRLKNGEEWFVMLCGVYPFRDLKESSTMQTSLQYAMQRGKDNPLWNPGDLMWDGVIIKEIQEISAISGVGDSSIDVGANFLLGAQTLGIAYAQTSKFAVDEGPHRDYGRQVGVGVSEIRGIEKLSPNSVQNMVTIYSAAVAD